MTPDAVNADGVVLSVVPGPGANGRSIASVTLKRADEVIRPVKSALQPPAADGRVSGAFYFRLEDFSALPVTIVCMNGTTTFSIALDGDDLAGARAAVNVAIGPAGYLAKLRAINDANTNAAQERAERDAEQRVANNAALYVKSSDYSVVEANGTFTKYRWRATIVNGSLRRSVFDVTAKFLDGSGAPIGSQSMAAEVISAQSETEVKGEAQIEAAKAGSLSKLTVVATRKGG